MPAKKTLTIWKGNTEAFSFRFKQDASTPFDLTGSRLVMTIRADTPIVKDSDISGWTINAAAGEATVTLTAAETAAFTSQYVEPSYEIERFIGAEQKTLLYGPIEVTGGLNGG
ncbi:DNA helicase loader protein [Rhizobium phage RHph_TM16]|nr:DNA helicase loader protein [Rhizobium phage RHph_TM16]